MECRVLIAGGWKLSPRSIIDWFQRSDGATCRRMYDWGFRSLTSAKEFYFRSCRKERKNFPEEKQGLQFHPTLMKWPFDFPKTEHGGYGVGRRGSQQTSNRRKVNEPNELWLTFTRERSRTKRNDNSFGLGSVTGLVGMYDVCGLCSGRAEKRKTVCLWAICELHRFLIVDWWSYKWFDLWWVGFFLYWRVIIIDWFGFIMMQQIYNFTEWNIY